MEASAWVVCHLPGEAIHFLLIPECEKMVRALNNLHLLASIPTCNLPTASPKERRLRRLQPLVLFWRPSLFCTQTSEVVTVMWIFNLRAAVMATLLVSCAVGIFRIYSIQAASWKLSKCRVAPALSHTRRRPHRTTVVWNAHSSRRQVTSCVAARWRCLALQQQHLVLNP